MTDNPAVVFVWSPGARPRLGTLSQPLVVGNDSLLTPWLSLVTTYADQIVELDIAFILMAVGVAGYVDGELGADPVQAAARSLDPPISFRSYTIAKGGGALTDGGPDFQ